MSSQQAVHDLIVLVGPTLDLAQVTEFEEDAAWRLVFDESIWVDLEYDDEGDRLILTGMVGAVAEAARARAYEALLRYNYLTTEHGVRAALDGAPGDVVLMVEMPAADADLPLLCQVLRDFRVVVEGWREALGSIAAETSSQGFEQLPVNMIRV